MLVRICLASVALALLTPASDAGPFRRWVSRHSHHAPVSRVYTANVPSSVPAPTYRVSGTPVQSGGEWDALDILNAQRAARGLRPYLRDTGLTLAARAAATFRARHLLFGHVTGGMGDFQFLAPGVTAAAAGCAAYPPQDGFLACAMYDGYTYAGAYTVVGPDGRGYHHLFVR